MYSCSDHVKQRGASCLENSIWCVGSVSRRKQSGSDRRILSTEMAACKCFLCPMQFENVIRLAKHIRCIHTGFARLEEPTAQSDKPSVNLVCSGCLQVKNFCRRRDFMTKGKKQHSCFSRYEASLVKSDMTFSFEVTQISIGLCLAHHMLAELCPDPAFAERQFRTLVGCDPQLEDKVQLITIWTPPDINNPIVLTGIQSLADYLNRPDILNFQMTPSETLDQAFLASIGVANIDDTTLSPAPSSSGVKMMAERRLKPGSGKSMKRKLEDDDQSKRKSLRSGSSPISSKLLKMKATVELTKMKLVKVPSKSDAVDDVYAVATDKSDVVIVEEDDVVGDVTPVGEFGTVGAADTDITDENAPVKNDMTGDNTDVPEPADSVEVVTETSADTNTFKSTDVVRKVPTTDDEGIEATKSVLPADNPDPTKSFPGTSITPTIL